MKTTPAVAETACPRAVAGCLRTACATRLVPLLLLLALPAAVEAQFNYATNNGAITITGYTGPGGEVTIPTTINGLPVTSIGDYAFYNGGHPVPYVLKSITIPDSITTIGFYAFAWEGSLTNVTFGNGVRSIGEGAFAQCWGLSRLTMGSGLSSVGDDAFYGCSGLTNVTFPASVTSIGDGAFTYCFALTKVFFQGNAPSLGSSPFFGDSNATVYYLPWTTGWGPTFGGLPTVPSYQPGFWTWTTNNGAITITEYTGPGGDVTIPDKINGLPVTAIGDGAFSLFPSMLTLTGVTIPNTVTSVGNQAFGNCWSLTNVAMPDSVTSIGEGAFAYCGLTSVTIPKSVTLIGQSAFEACTRLPAILVDPMNPAYTSVDGVLFNKNQTTLLQFPAGKAGSYIVPDSVTSIAQGGFYSCISLTGIYFEGNAPGLGSSAFYGDNNATVYYLPGTIGWGTAYGGRPTALWFLPNPLILTTSPNFGVRTNAFGFVLSWASNLPVVVEASQGLAQPNWSPLATNALTGGWSYFRDGEWTNYPGRFYRLRWP